MAKKKQVRARRKVMGLMGKAGVMVMAVPPIAGPAISAFKEASVHNPAAPQQDPNLASRLDIFWRSWLNGVTKGFSLGEPFPEVWVNRVSGAGHTMNIQAHDIPEGVWWKTTAAGGAMLAIDRLVAFALKRPVKLPGTNYTLTGN